MRAEARASLCAESMIYGQTRILGQSHGELNRFAVLCRRPAATCGGAAYGLRHFGSAVTRVWRDCAIIASGTLLRPR